MNLIVVVAFVSLIRSYDSICADLTTYDTPRHTQNHEKKTCTHRDPKDYGMCLDFIHNTGDGAGAGGLGPGVGVGAGAGLHLS